MLIMITFNDVEEVLLAMGSRLKEARLARNESQEVFAQRIGLSRQTYSKMEQGAATVPIGHWLNASSLLDNLSSWKEVLVGKKDLFAEYDQKHSSRKRASSKRIRRS